MATSSFAPPVGKALMGPLALLLMVALSTAASGDEVLNRARKRFKVVGADKPVPPPPAPPKKPPGRWRLKKTRIIRVINRGGNNPFNPVEPINNKDGRIGGGPGAVICGGKFAKYGVNGLVGNVAFGFNPATNTCSMTTAAVPAGPSVIALGINPTTHGQWAFIPNPGASIWEFVPPAVSIDFAFNTQPKTFRIRHKATGKVYEVTVQFDLALAGGVRLISIVPL